MYLIYAYLWYLLQTEICSQLYASLAVLQTWINESTTDLANEYSINKQTTD